jgi:predicted Rossmann fold nucleotide-binding protein DprA/Smf involved in DNA uptake
MNKREQARQRTAVLKRLREEHAETVARTQTLLKEQKRIHKVICQTIGETPKTVPEIAEETGMPTHEVLWHLTAYKKYDIVVEDGMCGEYVKYKRVQEKK